MKLGHRYRLMRIPSRARFPIDETLVARQRAAKAKLGDREPVAVHRVTE